MSGGTHDLGPQRPAPAVAYGTLTPCGDPFQRSSAQRCAALRGGCRPLQPTRSTPRRHRRQAVPPAGFGLLPVRSPLLRESSLFLGVLRCFSSPGALSGSLPECPAVRRAGCPIRTSPDHRLPAPPRGISPRGRVLPRPPTPRHPPCAHHADSCVPFPSGMPSCAATADRLAPAGRAPPGRGARSDARARPSRRTSPVLFPCVLCICMHVRAGDPVTSPRVRHRVSGVRAGARSRSGTNASDRPRARLLPRPQNPAGSAWRIVKVHERVSPLPTGGVSPS